MFNILQNSQWSVLKTILRLCWNVWNVVPTIWWREGMTVISLNFAERRRLECYAVWLLYRTDVSDELNAFFIRVTRIGGLGTTLAAISNRRTLWRRATRRNIPEDAILYSHLCENLKSYRLLVQSSFIMSVNGHSGHDAMKNTAMMILMVISDAVSV
jgi:hypothetical protein